MTREDKTLIFNNQKVNYARLVTWFDELSSNRDTVINMMVAKRKKTSFKRRIHRANLGKRNVTNIDGMFHNCM